MSLRENVKKLVVEHSRLVNENELIQKGLEYGDTIARHAGAGLKTLAGHAATGLEKVSSLGGNKAVSAAHGAGRVAVGGAAALGAKKLLGSAKQKVAGMAGG
jgi:hypothetical protein